MLSEQIKNYREKTKISQAQLAEMLGVGQSYISRVEKGDRVPQNIRFIDRINELIGKVMPAEKQADISQIYQKDEHRSLGGVRAILRLASIAREAGKADDAIFELREAINFLCNDDEVVNITSGERSELLIQAEMQFGVALGDTLFDAQHSAPTHYLHSAWRRSVESENKTVEAKVLRRLGNEYRKSGNYARAEECLSRALDAADPGEERGLSAVCLARLAMVSNQEREFFKFVRIAERELDRTKQQTMTFNPVSVGEVRIRGQETFRRLTRAYIDELKDSQIVGIAPQWSVIREITIGSAILNIGEKEEAQSYLENGFKGALLCAIPKQAKRAISTMKMHYHNTDEMFERLNSYVQRRDFIGMISN